MISVLLALGLQSTQAMPLATYDEHLARTERRKLDNAIEASCRFSATQRAMICDERLSRAVTAAETFDARVLPDAELRYLMGLAKRYLGEPTRAQELFEQALALEPQHVAASYDLGELLLIARDLDGAADCFKRVAKHNPDETTQWLGDWRLAEVAASRGDADLFETHLKLAVRQGFSLRRIEGLPNWRRYYQDPELRDVIEKMIALYGSPETLQTLKPETQNAASQP